MQLGSIGMKQFNNTTIFNQIAKQYLTQLKALHESLYQNHCNETGWTMGQAKYYVSGAKMVGKIWPPKYKNNLAERGFDPRTSGLWAQHASTAPLCCCELTPLKSNVLQADLGLIEGCRLVLLPYCISLHCWEYSIDCHHAWNYAPFCN